MFSPAVVTYGLLKASSLAVESHGQHVTQFISENFYVDDGLTSCATSEEAITLLRQTQDALMKYGKLRLHKFASNSKAVLDAFDQKDLAKDLLDLDLDKEQLTQRSLGLLWNLSFDAFVFSITPEVKPVSRRGVLSTINSLYNPLGFLSPVTIVGKLILRKVVADTNDWDEPLSEDLEREWIIWKKSLFDLEQVYIPRVMVTNLSKAKRTELLIFSDASEQAIAAVCYLRAIYNDGHTEIGFVLGKAKVAPVSGHTIPRLELCAAVLAVEIYQLVLDNLKMEFDSVRFFTDSRVVLGYICNDKRRFFVYVSNRVSRIRSCTTPDQWNYVPLITNPADQGTRGVNAIDIQNSSWLKGPACDFGSDKDTSYPLANHLLDEEVRIDCLKTSLEPTPAVCTPFGSDRFQRYSKWRKLVNVISVVRFFIAKCRNEETDSSLKHSVKSFIDTERWILKKVQHEEYFEEMNCLHSSQPIHRSSKIISLDPFLDQNGILRVGGRLGKMDTDTCFINPIIIPGNHDVARLLILMCHEEVAHQGRHFTEGRIRSHGYWITGCKRLVASIIHKCVSCKKLRGKLEVQKWPIYL